MNKIKNGRQGFTLIELLVVVIIIGILAAIALPQYRMVVLKSKFAKVKANVQALAGAMQRYYLEKGKYPENLSQLDIKVNNTDDTIYYTNSEKGDVGGEIVKSGKIILNYYIFLTNSTVNYSKTSENTYYCIAYKKFEMYDTLKQFCQQDTGKTESSYSTSAYTWYAY